MEYGRTFWCVENGGRLPARVYPRAMGFEYSAVDPSDTTGDCGAFLLRDFTIDCILPGETEAIRMTLLGSHQPKLHENSFDWDFASIPKAFRSLTCDKADPRIQVASLFHDIGFCVHEFWPGFDIRFWNRMIFEIMEAYSVTQDDVKSAVGWKAKAKMRARYLEDLCLRDAVYAGVTVGGPFAWKKTAEEIAMYSKMLRVERVIEYKGFTLA